MPTIMNIQHTTLYHEPVLAPDWHNKAQTWSDIMDDEDMSFVLQLYASNLKMSTASFVKQKKARIYSFWTPGNLPISKILEWQLPTDDMDVQDAKRYIKHEKEVHGHKFDYSEDLNDSDETNDQNPVNLNATIQDEAVEADDSD